MKRPRRARGFALLVVLVVLLLVESAALLITAAEARAATLERDAVRRLRLLALADSAADATLARLALDPAAAGLAPTPLGGGTIESVVEPAGECCRVVEARARLAGIERRVRLEVRLAAFGPPRVVAWRPLPPGPAI